MDFFIGEDKTNAGGTAIILARNFEYKVVKWESRLKGRILSVNIEIPEVMEVKLV